MRKITKKWAWLICAVLVVAVAVTAVLLFTQEPEVKLYYNMDGSKYQHPDEPGKSTREPAEDGLYHIRFSLDGQVVEYTTQDAALVDKIDTLQVLTLTADETGKIQEIHSAETVAQKLSDRDLVQQLGEKELLLNSSIAFNGAQKTLPLGKNCAVYNVTPATAEPGTATELKIMDEVLIYGNRRGQATHIFVLQRVSDAKLYWRVDRNYDSKEKTTTREPDENGVYTIPFAIDGQQQELMCKDKDLVTRIDTPSTTDAAMGLVLDADGYIIDMLDVYLAVRGSLACDMYDVTQVEENTFAAVNRQAGNQQGMTYQGVMGQDCQIINVSDTAEFDGELTDSLLPDDRITVYTDSMGVARYIFVHVRRVDSPLYFNLERMYKSPDTTREPDAEGWYVFRMLCDGEVVTLKTQDRKVARQVDVYSAKGVGLKLNGDVIEKVYSAACVTGSSALASGRFFYSLAGSVLTTKASQKGRQAAVVMAADCKIYDATDAPGTTLGEETTLQYWDKVYIFGNADGLATHIFVTQREIGEG